MVLSTTGSIVMSRINPLFESPPELHAIVDYIDIFSVIGFVSLGLVFINEVAWKWKILNWLVDIPNLNGRYTGELSSSYKDSNGMPVKKKIAIEISQNASALHISAYSYDDESGQTSAADSILSEIVKEKNGFFKIYYIYANDPATMQPELRKHGGVTILKYHPEDKELEGEYYNQRGNQGVIKSIYIDRKLKGRY